MGEFSTKEWKVKDGIKPAAIAAGILIAVPFVLSYLIQRSYSTSLIQSDLRILSDFFLYALILGAAVSVAAFAYGCYQKGTRSRLTFGLVSAALIIIYSYVLLIMSGLNSVFTDIGLHLDTGYLALLVGFASVLVMFSVGGEYIAWRGSWLHSVGIDKAVKPIDPSSMAAEFDPRIGSTVAGKKSMILGYLALVLVPAALVLVMIAYLGQSNSFGAYSLVRSMDHMMTIIVGLAIPIMVISWANGFYPKGSFGRFLCGSIFALLLGIWLVLILLDSGLRKGISDYGFSLQLDRVLVLVCLFAIFYFGRALFELIDERKAFRKSIGAKLETVPPIQRSEFLDFDPRIGKLRNGNTSAMGAYLRFLVVPTILLVLLIWVVGEFSLTDNNAITTSLISMFDIVLWFGIAMVVVRFPRGFYPSGSLGRVVFGLIGIPILFSFAWVILMGSGIQEALQRNHFIMDMSIVLLPVLIYILYTVVIEASELIDNRRKWHKDIGIPVEPYVPEENYNVLKDFRPRYASFVIGAIKGRKVLNKYIFRRILVILILEAFIASILNYYNNKDLNNFIGMIFSNGLNQAIGILMMISVAIALAVFLQMSYRKGSFARLVLSGVVFLVSSIWIYVFWSEISKNTSIGFITTITQFLMYGLIIWAGIKALWSLYSYSTNRDKYMDWRKTMLEKEGVVPEPLPVGSSPVTPMGK